MNHPHFEPASAVLDRLFKIKGILACVVRAHADAPPTPDDLREELEAKYDQARSSLRISDDVDKAKWVDQALAARLGKDLDDASPPFPHLTSGPHELVHHLRSLTDMLAPVSDERIDAKIGALRFIAESWGDHADPHSLIVAVAIPQNDQGVKSLMRALRRIRKSLRK